MVLARLARAMLELMASMESSQAAPEPGRDFVRQDKP
jgi:hypothetical protein